MEIIKDIAKKMNISEKQVAKIYLSGFQKGAFNNIERKEQRDIEEKLYNIIY